MVFPVRHEQLFVAMRRRPEQKNRQDIEKKTIKNMTGQWTTENKTGESYTVRSVSKKTQENKTIYLKEQWI